MPGSEPGERRGGRKPGVPNKATAEVRLLAREHRPAAIKELARLATEARSGQARIAASNALLDRAYGRSQVGQPIEIDLPDTSTVQGVSLALAAIVSAAACGKLTPAEAQALCSVIEAQRKAIELADHDERLKRLEKAAAARF
jgi:hypothetical protein